MILRPYDELCELDQQKLKRIYMASFPKGEQLDFDEVMVAGSESDEGVQLYGLMDDAADDTATNAAPDCDAATGSAPDGGTADNAAYTAPLVGLTFVLHDMNLLPELAYVYFLAIDGGTRGRGYGSQALEAIRAAHPGCNVALDIETVAKMDGTESDADRATRERRLRFYEKNGFVFTGITMDSPFVPYDLMFHPCEEGGADPLEGLDFERIGTLFEHLEQSIPGFHI